MFMLVFVLTASCEYSTSWSIMWTTCDFTNKESKLPHSNDVDDTWNIIEQAVNLVISDHTVFLNLHYGDVENSADATVQENFKSLEKILS